MGHLLKPQVVASSAALGRVVTKVHIIELSDMLPNEKLQISVFIAVVLARMAVVLLVEQTWLD